ncbi:MAG: glutamate:GABA antiporter [Acidobacteriota bacterium]|jgi:amino acid transporter|nr:glutamate:GABA antiporter [Acidobacteriota bacterium]
MADDDNQERATTELLAAEERVEERSRVFKKELGLRDLVLTQILYIVGLSWVGAAAKLSTAHIVFWLLAIILFYLPSAAVVVYLNRLMPLEGGLYQWAKLGLSDFVGFMVAWNLWLYVIVLNSEIGLQLATNLSYALGPKAAWLAGSKWFIAVSGCAIIGLMTLVSTRGLGVGKWIHNAGGLIILIVFALLIALPLLNLARGTISEYHPLAITMPALSLLNLNILGKMGFGALGGFEYVGILAGECRDPVRSINRSVLIAAPIIAVMFILGTSSVLAFVRPDNVDLLGPIPQVLSLGFSAFGFVARVVSVVILALLAIRLAQASISFTGSTRLPMVAGWDRLLPNWFTRLHPKHKTPVNSIIFVGIMTFVFGLMSIIGVGQQEAYQLLQNASGIFYALTYLVMFSIPLIGLSGIRAPLWLKVVSVSGLLMTLLYVTLSVFPIINVESWFAFASKIIAVILVANIIGTGIFLFAKRRREQKSVPPAVAGG